MGIRVSQHPSSGMATNRNRAEPEMSENVRHAKPISSLRVLTDSKKTCKTSASAKLILHQLQVRDLAPLPPQTTSRASHARHWTHRLSTAEINIQVEVGEGAFAVVHRCVLRRDASASFSGARSKGAVRGRQLVAVKQLKPAVLENEIELHGFIAETSGACCL